MRSKKFLFVTPVVYLTRYQASVTEFHIRDKKFQLLYLDKLECRFLVRKIEK